VGYRYAEALAIPALAAALMEATDQLQPSEASFATFLRQVVTIIWERRPVGEPVTIEQSELGMPDRDVLADYKGTPE
jgi:hypothetical protein